MISYSKTGLTKIGVLFLILLLSSCNAVKRVKEKELLLTKNTVYVNDEKESGDNVQSLVLQKPNSSLLGIPLRLHIYNMAKEYPDTAFQHWLHKKEKREPRLNNFLSPKQVIELENSYKGINNWLKKTGEAPVVIDYNKVRKSLTRLRLYYESKGFFNAKASYKITKQKNKRAALDYYVTTGNPYFLDSITRNIAAPDLDSIYLRHKARSLIKEGDQFNAAILRAELNRLSSIFINSGIYKFQSNSIKFNIEWDTLAANKDYKMPVEVSINNLIEREANDSIREIPYKVHKISDVNIYVDAVNDDDSLQSVSYKDYTIYYKDKLHYRPRALANSVAIHSGDIYSDADRSLTNRQISNLKTFKYPSINYRYTDSTNALLATNIYLNSRPRFSLGFDTDVSHSNIQDFGISFSGSVISRNVFRGAEILELSARGTLGSSKEASNPEDRFFNISEIGADVRLNFPRFFFLFNTDKIIPKYMTPETRISLGTTVQTNIGLDKQSFNGVLRYTWNPSSFTKKAFELFNIQFIRNVNIDNFFNVYRNTEDRLLEVAVNNAWPDLMDDEFETTEDADLFIDQVSNNDFVIPSEDQDEVRRINERKTRLTDNNLIVASNFTYTRNSRTGPEDNNFSQFRTKIELAGNLLSAFAGALKLKENENGQYELFKVAYSQYVKTEFDYIKYWSLSDNNTLAFRSFIGIAVPYGNAESIPFSRSYFGGGSNDNRAWEAYSLGPGGTLALNDFNEANLKLAFNLEYRFNIFGNFNGALFSDVGNIWNIWDNVENVEDENPVFDSFSSLKDIAVGTGFGIRYDFGFFVLRFDTGFKTYNPAYETGRRWFTDYNFSNAVYNIGINYPF